MGDLYLPLAQLAKQTVSPRLVAGMLLLYSNHSVVKRGGICTILPFSVNSFSKMVVALPFPYSVLIHATSIALASLTANPSQSCLTWLYIIYIFARLLGGGGGGERQETHTIPAIF